MHGPGQLFGHLQLPEDVDRVLVLLQVGVQRAKLHVLLHHDVCRWEEDGCERTHSAYRF